MLRGNVCLTARTSEAFRAEIQQVICMCLPAAVPHGVDTGPTHGCIRNELRVENYLVTLLDVGGSVESRGTWRQLSGEAHGIIFVVDSSDRQRMKEVKEVLTDFLKQTRVARKPILV